MNHVSVKRAPLSEHAADGKGAGEALCKRASGATREEREMETENLGPSSGIAAHLTVRDGRGQEAIAFYEKAFGAKEEMRRLADDGKRLMHAHLTINGGSLMLNDDFPEYRAGTEVRPPAGVTLHLQVPDADAAWEMATAAGAKVVFPLENQFWGDRYGQVEDPFGFTWSIGGPVKE
jgi:PhnB protein